MSRFTIGQSVKLSQYTGDDQIDFYYGQTLQVTDDLWHAEPSHVNSFFQQMQQYEITTPDHQIIVCNEYELEAV